MDLGLTATDKEVKLQTVVGFVVLMQFVDNKNI